MDLHRDEDVIAASGLDELVMFAGGFDDGLGDKNIKSAAGGLTGHFEVEIVGSEDEDGVSGIKFVECGKPGFGVVLIVGRKGAKAAVESVALGDEAVEV